MALVTKASLEICQIVTAIVNFGIEVWILYIQIIHNKNHT